jgi:hypothetical protein
MFGPLRRVHESQKVGVQCEFNGSKPVAPKDFLIRSGERADSQALQNSEKKSRLAIGKMAWLRILKSSSFLE